MTATLGSTGISISPDGQELYVANSSADSVSIVDIATGNLRSIQVGSQPVAVGDTPDGRWGYVANKGSNHCRSLMG